MEVSFAQAGWGWSQVGEFQQVFLSRGAFRSLCDRAEG